MCTGTSSDYMDDIFYQGDSETQDFSGPRVGQGPRLVLLPSRSFRG